MPYRGSLGLKALLLLPLLLPMVAGNQPRGPVVGILTNPTTDCGSGVVRPGSCFNTLYVDWLQAAGARVMPILHDSPPESLDRAFASVNGILLTGGNINQTDFDSPYIRAAARLLNRSVHAARQGDWVPIWGTCQGMQLLLVLSAHDPAVLSKGAFDAEDLELPLKLADAAAKSRMFGDQLPVDVRAILTTEAVTENLHRDGTTPAQFYSNFRLTQQLKILSTNRDRNGKEFVSSIEGNDTPVFGVQWHPERSQFQFDTYKNINHNAHAVRAMQWTANFLVSETRLNKHRFTSREAEEEALIYNYVPEGNSSTRVYYFPPGTAL